MPDPLNDTPSNSDEELTWRSYQERLVAVLEDLMARLRAEIPGLQTLVGTSDLALTHVLAVAAWLDGREDEQLSCQLTVKGGNGHPFEAELRAKQEGVGYVIETERWDCSNRPSTEELIQLERAIAAAIDRAIPILVTALRDYGHS
jgi:hypothetical protein